MNNNKVKGSRRSQMLKRITLIIAVLAVCISQSWGQNIDTVSISICRDNFPYTHTKVNGQRVVFQEEGLYFWDSIPLGTSGYWIIYANLIAIENETVDEYLPFSLCQNKTINIYNTNINGADYPLGDTTLQITVSSVSGCRTYLTLHFTVAAAYDTIIEDKICVGEYYRKNGFWLEPHYTARTFYYLHDPPLQSQYGCDSIVTLKLTVHPKENSTIYDEICEGEIYTGNGFNDISAPSGVHTYTNRDTTIWGCDSITTLILTVHNNIDTLEVSVCRNKLPYPYRKRSNGLIIYCDTGLQIVDTIRTGSFCDSFIYLNLIAIDNPPWNEYTLPPLCQNKTLNFRGNIIHGSNYPLGETTLHYIVPAIDSYSCDTLMTLHLTVVPAYDIVIFDTICVGETYSGYGFGLPAQNFEGTFYYDNTEYLNNTTRHGCDSIVTLVLTVNPKKETIIYDGICDGETYTDNDFNVSEQGTYRHNLTTAEGCDSIVTLILTVYQAGENYPIEDSICEGNIYRVNGFNINATSVGTIDTTENRETNDGCPYTITLTLKVLPNLKMDTLPLDKICGDDSYFPVRYRVDAGRIESVFVYFDEKAKSAGFKDFIEHNPNIDHIKIPLPTNVRPDNYSVTLYFDGRCGDATFTVNFTVLYSASAMEQRWNDVITLKNAAYNGGYDFSYIQWLVNETPVNPQFDKGTYIYTENSTLQFGAEYRVCLIRIGEYHQICSCPLIPVQHYDCCDYPRIATTMGKIKVYSNEQIVELSLINMLGQTVRTGRYAHTELEINANAGIYVLQLVTDKGQIYTQKVIVPQ